MPVKVGYDHGPHFQRIFETSGSFWDVVEEYLVKLLAVKDCVYTFTGWEKMVIKIAMLHVDSSTH